jgi:SPP1 gp7 family putative phage head morphogenesis protein
MGWGMTEVEDIVEEMGNRFAVRVSDRTRENLIRAYGRGADLVAYEATGKTGPVSLGGSTPSRVDAVIKEVCKPIEDWNRQLASDVSDAVRQKMAEGASPGELARFIREDLAEKIGDRPVTIHRDGKRPWTSTPKNYADLVSRTLPNRLRNEAYLEHGEKMGIYDGWVSIATGDERMCSICGARHGRFFPFGADVPPYHPRCRCRAVLHLREGATPPEGAPSPEELAWCKVAWEEIDDAYAKVVALDEERKRLAIRARGEPLAGADAKKLAQIEAQMARLRSKAAKKQAELYRVRAKFHAQMSWQQAEDRLRVGAGRDFAHFEGLKNSAARDVGAVLNAYMTDYPEFFADQMGLVLTHTEIGRGAVDRTLQREMVDELVRRGASRDWAQFVVGQQAKGRASELVKSLMIPPEGIPWATRRGDLGGLRVLVLHDQTVGDLDALSAAMLQDVLAGRRSWGSENPLSVIESEMGRTIASKLDLAYKGTLLSDLYDSIGPARIRDELSAQATVSRQDFLAEAWVEFRLSPSPRPLATAVGRYMEEELQVYEQQHRGQVRPAGSLGARLLDPATPVRGEVPKGPNEAEIDAKVEESKRLRQRWADLAATIRSMNAHIKRLASRAAIPRAEIGSAEARYAIAREAETELTQTHRAILDIDAWFRSSGVSPVPIAPWSESRIELDPMPDLRGEAMRKALALEKQIEQGIAQLRTWAAEIEDFNSNVVTEIESGMGEDEMRSWLATVISTHKEMRALHKSLEPLVAPVKEWLDRDLGPALADSHPDKTKIAHTLGSLLEMIKGRLAGEAAEKLREAAAPHPGGVHETAEMVDLRARLLETEAELARLRAEGSVGTIPQRNQLLKEVVDMRREYGELMKADVLARSKVPHGRAVKESDKHLRTYLADTYGHKVRVNYGAVAKDSANLLNSMVAEYMEYAPTPKKGFGSIGDAATSGRGDYSSAYAFTSGKMFGPTDRVGLYLNGSSEYFGDRSNLIASLRRDVQVGFHPPGTDTEKGVIDHEMAHVLDFWYGLSNNRKINAIWDKHFTKEIKSGLSEYALENEREFIAEAWSEYKNSPNPRPISVEVGQAIEERIAFTLKRKGRSLPGRVESPKPTVPPQMKERLKSLRSKFGGLRLYILTWNETASKLQGEGLVRSQVETYVRQQETALKNAVTAAQVAAEIRQIEEMYRAAGEEVPGKEIDSTVPPATRLDFDELVEKRAKLSKKRFADLLSQMRTHLRVVASFNESIESQITADADFYVLVARRAIAAGALQTAVEVASELLAVAEEIERATGEDYVSKISPDPREIELVVTEAEIQSKIEEAKKRAEGEAKPPEPVPGGPNPYQDPGSKMYAWGGFERSVTAEERKVIDRYCSNDFEEINPLLRESRNFVREGDPDLVEKIQILDDVVSRGRLKPQTVYRGMTGYPEVVQKFVKGVGTEVMDKAFVSTTADLDVAKGFAADSMGLPSVLLEIQVPKGAPGVFVAPFSEAVTETGANENEILLPRNSRFKILSATRSSDGSYRVAAEMIVEG